jgi:hypothetical protein
MEAVRYYVEALNVHIGSSTFGRIFRLEGCGHVSAACQMEFNEHGLNSYLGHGDQEYQVYNRSSGWTHDILHHGVYHCSQRECHIHYVEFQKLCG